MNLILSCLCCALVAGSPLQELSSDLPEVLRQIDQHSSRITTLKAKFKQVKHSDLLRKPLTSSGIVRMLEDRVRWDTELPSTSVLMASSEGVRIYYPDLRVVEIYPLSDRLKQLAGSPVFRLSELSRHFTIQSDLEVSESGELSLDLVPSDESLGKHLRSIHLDVHVDTGIVRRAEVLNADDERTEIIFEGIRINSPMDASDIELRVPDDARTVHPLGKDPQRTSSENGADA